jgi:hypothetical protein
MEWIFWLIAVILSAAAGYFVFRADKKRAVPYPWLTSVLRSLVVFFTLLLILVPTIVITRNVVEKPIVLVLQDNSRSIANALGNDSGSYRISMKALMQRLSDKYRVVQWGFGSVIQQDSLFQYKQSATDISDALLKAQEYFGLQNLGAVILASDGRFNQGLNPLFQQLAVHSPLYTVALGDSAVQKDLRISRVYANKLVTVNSSFEIRADIVALLCKGYNNGITIKEEGDVLSAIPLSVAADKFDRSVSFTIKATHPGLHHYVISVPKADNEKNEANNRKDIFVDVVDEKKNVLIASAAPHPDINAVREALNGLESYKITIVTADNFPASLSNYDVVILHGLPSLRNNIASQVLAARKPLWLILTSQSNIPGLNSLQVLTHTTINPAPPHDATLFYNTSFNAFTLPQQIQAVADKMPPLQVKATVAASPGANALFMEKSGITAGQVPLWLLQQGSVPSAILMGEGLWRCRLYEFKNFNDHSVIDECIRQTVAFLSANNREKPFSVVLPKYLWSDQETISLNAYLLNANNEQINTADVQIVITDSSGRKQNFSFERSGNAYALNIGIWAGGTYSYTAQTTYNNKPYAAAGTFVVESMPLELMEPGADYPLMYGLARKYNGGFVTAANLPSLYDSITHNDHVKPLILATTETVPLVDRKWFFFIILLLAVTEWFLRKYWLAQ